ncbi:MAG: T9SS type A sorting domain-containing protein [Ignavibacteria bacterium]|nr:T9SS type A sorting domain-containing protein [Ignavibacteria bacterium]
MKKLKHTPVLLLMFFIPALIFAQSGWQCINSYYPYSFETGKFASESSAYITGSGFRGVLKSTDKGKTWLLKSNGILQNSLFLSPYLEFFDANTGIYAGEYGLIYKTTNGGESWLKILSSDLASAINSVYFINVNTGFAGVRFSNVLMRTTNSGKDWNAVCDFSDFCRNLFFFNESIGFRTKFNNDFTSFTLKKTINGGLNWDSIYCPETAVISIKKINDNEFLFLNSKRAYKFNKSENSWMLIASSLDEYPFVYSDVINSSSYIITCSNKLIEYTTNGGADWQSRFIPVQGFTISNGNREGITAGNIGKIYYSSPDFTNFTDVNANKVTEKINDFQILDENNIFIYADSNCIVKSSNGGTSWLKVPQNFSPNSYSFVNLNTGYAAYNKNVCKTTNGGISWDTVFRYTNSQQGYYSFVNNVNFISPEFGMLTLSNSIPQNYYFSIYYTTNGGYNWQPLGAGGRSSYYGASGTSDGLIDFQMKSPSVGYTISTHAESSHYGYTISYGLKKTTNMGQNWVSIYSGLNAAKVTSISFTDELTGYALTDSTFLKKTTDGGTTWQFVTNLPVSGVKLTMINTLTGYFQYNNDIYRTTDGGYTWINTQTESILQNITNPIKIKFLNTDIGYLTGSIGAIYKTTTGGMVFVNNNNLQLADKYFLSQNYPNPFNPETKIQFSIPKNGFVKIIVYDLLGREVEELVNEFKQQGSYYVTFNGANLSSGIYFYRLVTNDFIETKKMILVK